MKWSVHDFIIESNAIEDYFGDEYQKGTIYYDQYFEAFEYLLSNELNEKNILLVHRMMMKGLLYKDLGISFIYFYKRLILAWEVAFLRESYPPCYFDKVCCFFFHKLENVMF